MDYKILKSEIALPAYVGMSDAQIVTALNNSVIAAFRDVDPLDWYDTLINSGEWGRIEHWAQFYLRTNPTGTVLAPSAQDVSIGKMVTFFRAVTGQRPIRASVEATRTTYSGILNNLVTANFIIAGTRTALIAFAQTTISRAQQFGLPAVDGQAIITARLV